VYGLVRSISVDRNVDRACNLFAFNRIIILSRAHARRVSVDWMKSTRRTVAAAAYIHTRHVFLHRVRRSSFISRSFALVVDERRTGRKIIENQIQIKTLFGKKKNYPLFAWYCTILNTHACECASLNSIANNNYEMRRKSHCVSVIGSRFLTRNTARHSVRQEIIVPTRKHFYHRIDVYMWCTRSLHTWVH
jgi:hypothetical protein